MKSRAYRWLARRWRTLRRCGFLLRSFRNGPHLAYSHLRRVPCARAVTRDGLTLDHPADQLGLTDTLAEIWHDEVYTGRFYRPAPGDVVIDAGANVGLFAVWLAWRTPGCQVLALEPFAENYRLLCRNAEGAGGAVRAVRAALGGRTGHGRMRVRTEWSLDHQLAPAGPDDPDAVPVYSFRDALDLAGAATVALFKVDIEGSEYDLFAGASPDDLRRVDRFAVEFHDNIRPGTLDLVRSRLDPTHVVLVSCPSGNGCGMLYATRRGSAGSARAHPP